MRLILAKLTQATAARSRISITTPIASVSAKCIGYALCDSKRWISGSSRERRTFVGITTPQPEEGVVSRSPYHFDTGYAVMAKRPSRAFPPPFFSPPSGSFSDPLSTHDRSRDKRASYKGQMIRGLTNGDDAILAEANLICANDGVGAWATRERGHAALWSRLILHFYALEMGKVTKEEQPPQPVECLQRAFESTKKATSEPNQWQGTTTTATAFLHHDENESPLLYVTNLGDSRVMVIRPSAEEVLFKTTEQWHWFDCPYQLGTNSVDSPEEHAILNKVSVELDDIVIAMSDGLCDNLWDHEIVSIVVKSINAFTAEREGRGGKRSLESSCMMSWVAEELVREARLIAEDPFAESPFMERAVEDGISYEGGKMDDISVVTAMCKRRAG